MAATTTGSELGTLFVFDDPPRNHRLSTPWAVDGSLGDAIRDEHLETCRHGLGPARSLESTPKEVT